MRIIAASEQQKGITKNEEQYEKNVPTLVEKKSQQAWLPQKNVDRQRSQSAGCSPSQRQKKTDRPVEEIHKAGLSRKLPKRPVNF